MAIQVLVPNNLNFDELKEQHPYISLPTKDRSTDYLYYIVSSLIKLKQNSGDWQEIHGGFTSLCSMYLRDIHLHYEEFMSYLVSAGVLFTDGIFITGRKCFGYKLSDSYSGRPMRQVMLNDYILLRSIKRQEKCILQLKQKELKHHYHILNWYLGKELEIDKDAALDWLGRDYEERVTGLSELNHESRLKEISDILDGYQASKRFVNAIANKDYGLLNFSVCDFGRRLHGMFTYHRRELRNFVKFKGQKLISLDIKNSQPYFSIAMLNPGFWKSRKAAGNELRLQQINQKIYQEIKEDHDIYRCITLLDSSESLARRRVSQRAFMEDVVSGQLYEKFERRFQQQPANVFKERYYQRMSSRDAIKKEVFRTMYGDPRYIGESFYYPSRILTSMYPDVFKFFRELNKKEYNLAARIIQQVESHCVLNLICKRIAMERPEIPLFTIHDSIVSTEGNINYIKALIEEVLTQKIGYPPTLRAENWE